MHIGSSVKRAITVAIEKDNALCPLGMPPFNGVPSPNIAFTIIVANVTITLAELTEEWERYRTVVDDIVKGGNLS